MTEEEAKKLKQGDWVLVKGLVIATDQSADEGKPIRVSFGNKGGEIAWPPFDRIHSVLPRPLEVGDRVRSKLGEPGRMLAVHEGFGWVLLDHLSEPLGYHLASLERVQ